MKVELNQEQLELRKIAERKKPWKGKRTSRSNSSTVIPFQNYYSANRSYVTVSL